MTALVGLLSLWPAELADRDAVDTALVLLLAVAMFFVACLILQTPALRTTVFVVLPLTLARCCRLAPSSPGSRSVPWSPSGWPSP